MTFLKFSLNVQKSLESSEFLTITSVSCWYNLHVPPVTVSSEREEGRRTWHTVLTCKAQIASSSQWATWEPFPAFSSNVINCEDNSQQIHPQILCPLYLIVRPLLIYHLVFAETEVNRHFVSCRHCSVLNEFGLRIWFTWLCTGLART